MNFSTILQFALDHIDLVSTAAFAVFSFVVNIILGITKKNKSKLIAAIKMLPQVINSVEEISKGIHLTPSAKKALALATVKDHFGSLYSKNSKLFDDAIEDILSTPQKKGGSIDVSQKS